MRHDVIRGWSTIGWLALVACVDVTPPAGLTGKDDAGARPALTPDGPPAAPADVRPPATPDAGPPAPDAPTPAPDAPGMTPDAPVDSPPPPPDLAVDTAPLPPDAARSTLVVGLVGYWKLDETAGLVAEDSSGSGNRGMHVNAPVISATVAPLMFPDPRCLTFDPALNNAVVVPDSPSLSITGPFTVAAWVRRNVATSPVYEPIVEKWETTPKPQKGYFLRLAPDGHVIFAVLAADGTNTNTSPSPSPSIVAADVWTHVAGVYDGTTLLVYVNGVAYGSKPVPVGPGDGTSALEIGHNSGQSFPGSLDDVRVYNRALSAAEIASLARGAD